jgi:LysR family transcriptional regulator, regulator for metE and metH
MINLKHLLLVQAVADEGTLTRAGEKLFLSQSALSHQLKELEQSLGVPVFHRIRKRLILTDTGRMILDASRSVMKEIENIKVEINLRRNGQSGRIRMATECYTTYNWLPPVIKQFNLTFPNVDIQIVTDDISDPAQLLLDGKLDLALLFRVPKGDAFECRELADDEMVAVVSRDHRWARKKWIQAADLADETLITHIRDYRHSFLFEELLRPASVKPKKVIHIQLTEANIEMVKAGLGVTIINSWIARNYRNDKRLSFIPVTKKGLYRKWFVAIPGKGSRPLYLKAFVELVQSTFEHH